MNISSYQRHFFVPVPYKPYRVYSKHSPVHPVADPVPYKSYLLFYSKSSPVLPVADVVAGDGSVTEDVLGVFPRDLEAGRGQRRDADVARRAAGSLAVRHKLGVKRIQQSKLPNTVNVWN